MPGAGLHIGDVQLARQTQPPALIGQPQGRWGWGLGREIQKRKPRITILKAGDHAGRT